MVASCSPAAAVVAAPARLEQVPCNLCGAWDAALLYPGTVDLADQGLHPQEVFACTSVLYGRYGPVVRCRQCGLTYLNPRLTAAAVEAAYQDVADTRYLEERDGRRHTFARALDELEDVLAPARGEQVQRGRLLDVGCHVGVFLELAAARGWHAEGIEPSRWAAACAREQGLNVTCGTLQASGLPPACFDVVTMWDVIEHLADPAAELRAVHRLLRPGGVVGITTMDIDSVMGRLLGRRWPWLMQMHLYYFSERTLRAMLQHCGYEVIAVTPHRRIVRLQYLLSRAERLSARLASWAEASARRLGLADWLVPIDLGDIITVYARRAARADEIPTLARLRA